MGKLRNSDGAAPIPVGQLNIRRFNIGKALSTVRKH